MAGAVQELKNAQAHVKYKGTSIGCDIDAEGILTLLFSPRCLILFFL